MDVEQLHVVLQQSFSPDGNVRKPAEQTIRNLKHLNGATPMLLQVAAEKQVRFEVRQAAAIQLKNLCREGWAERMHYGVATPYYGIGSTGVTASGSTNNGNSNPADPSADGGGGGDPAATAGSSQPGSGGTSTNQPLLPEPDKEAVKAHLIPALLEEPEKSIRDLLAETLHTIVIHDFPEKWTTLVSTILSTIQTGIMDLERRGLQVHNALLALRKVCKRYEYKSKEQRGPLNEIVRVSFPLLLPLGQRLSQPDQHSLEAAMMLKQILKIFWSSTQFYLPGEELTGGGDGGGGGSTTAGAPSADNADNKNAIFGLTRPEQLQPWFDIVTAALKKPLPEADTGLEPRGQPVDVEQRNAWPWWKVKKWSIQIMSRHFSRYGIPSYADDDTSKQFAIHFSYHVAPQFLGPVFDTLNLRPSGQFCTDRVLHLCLTFVDLAVELSSTYKLLKPHLDFLLYQVCFPTICLKEDDIDCFNNDPIEFVHKQNSPLADFYDPRMSAITLVTDLVKHRGQDVTHNLLSRMTEILHRYSMAPVEQKNHIEKDGALLMFGSLSKFLLAKEKYQQEIVHLLTQLVFPDFNSPIAFLRYRACWMVQQFSTIQFNDDGTILRNLLEMILSRFHDTALPVQIEASKALRFLIEADGAEVTLLPVLPQLLSEYFRIMNSIGNDEVVSALQVLLDKFGDHIEPHAAALVTQLSNAFSQYCSAGDDDDDDDAALAAAECLECIATVLKGVCGNPTILRSLEPLLVPLVLKILGNDGDFIEYLECALDILTFLTYFQTTLTPEVWQAFPLIYIAFDQWAYDYLNMMVPCLQSYITKAPEVFLNGTFQLPEGVVTYIDLIVSMVAKTVTNDRASESECRYALSLFMCILHNCPRGKVDAYIPFMNEIALGKLGQQINEDIPLTRISIYQVLGSALYYNPQLELMELEKRGVTQQVFTKWLSDAEQGAASSNSKSSKRGNGNDGDGQDDDGDGGGGNSTPVGMERWLPRKLTILGIASILSVNTAALPPSIAGALPQLIHAAVNMSLALKEEVEKTDDAGAASGAGGDGFGIDADDHGNNHQVSGSNNMSNINGGGAGRAKKGNATDKSTVATATTTAEDIGDLDHGFTEDEDVTNEVDAAYRKALQGVTSWDDDMAKFLLNDFDEDGEDIDEDYTSPITENVDELCFVNDMLKHAFQREPETYQQVQNALPPESVVACQRLFAMADTIRMQQQQQAAQQVAAAQAAVMAQQQQQP